MRGKGRALPAASLFERGWSRIGGSAGTLGRHGQKIRAARGATPAIFKAILQGGCHTGAQLRAQLSYLTTKSSLILDSRGTHDGKRVLNPGEIDRLARRFENGWNERHSPKLGHTCHLLMAFPIGTRSAEVKAITEEVCERFFEGQGARFDYIAAIHEDRAHPHAHIVVNRRSPDGEMFRLSRDHHFSYEAFRTAMVEAADRHGLRLEATRRLERGVLMRQGTDAEYRAARAAKAEPAERDRQGADLARALAEIAGHARVYQGLAADASASNFTDVAEALSRAAVLLTNGGQVVPDGVLYMSEHETAFDELLASFSENIRGIEAAIEMRPLLSGR